MPTPEASKVASVTLYAQRAVDAVAGVLCAVLVAWVVPLVAPTSVSAGVVVALAALGWLVRRRVWAIAFTVAALSVAVFGAN